MTRYRVGLASAPIAGFMVTYNKHTLGLEDLGTLEEQNWLNDQVRKEEECGQKRFLVSVEILSVECTLPSNEEVTSWIESSRDVNRL